MAEELWDDIVQMALEIWEFIKKMFLKIVNFFNNIVSFFKDPSILHKLEEDKNNIAVVIKDNLENGNYRVINCLYNKESETLVDCETSALGIEAYELDDETADRFGDKAMIVLQ